MQPATLDALLDDLAERGFILFSEDETPKVTYDFHVWVATASWMVDNLVSAADRLAFVNECIFAHDDGQQMTEEERADFILACATGHAFVPERLMLHAINIVEKHHEQALIRKCLEGRSQRSMQAENEGGFGYADSLHAPGEE